MVSNVEDIFHAPKKDDIEGPCLWLLWPYTHHCNSLRCRRICHTIPYYTGWFFEGEVEIHSCKTNRAGWKIPPNFDGICQERWGVFMGELLVSGRVTLAESKLPETHRKRPRRPPWSSPWTASSLRMTTSLRPRISSSSCWNALRWMERLATWETRSASTGRRPRSMSLPSLLSPSVTWSIWARSTWRPSNCETSCASLPLTRPPTRCATSTSMMRRMRRNEKSEWNCLAW